MEQLTSKDPWSDQDFIMQRIIKNLLITIAFNTIIAGFIYFTDLFHVPFIQVFTISQCIGISICFTIGFSFRRFKPRDNRVKLILLLSAIILGTLIGFTIGMLLFAQNITQALTMSSFFTRTLILGLLFGIIVSYFFISRHTIALANLEIQEERLKRIILEKQTTEAQLKLLQAQIEPHFLFNTLSNVISLLETDSEKGRAMLMDLTRYLRAALDKSRSSNATLGQEIELIKAYLKIHAIRMGERLKTEIILPESLKKIPFPPMLIQPLVENAIKHGLDPMVDGGTLTLKAAIAGTNLQIIVQDNGKGFSQSSPKGVGLSNIQERLNSLYSGKAHLTLQKNNGPGITALMEVPIETAT